MNRWIFRLYFLTLVVSPAMTLAAPNTPTPRPFHDERSTSADGSPPQRHDLQWSYPKGAETNRDISTRASSAPSRRVSPPGPWTLSPGLRNGTNRGDESPVASTTITLKHRATDRPEYSAEFDTKGFLRIGVAGFLSLRQDSPRQPFAAFGVQQTLTPQAFLGSAVDLQTLALVGTLGLGQLFDRHPGWSTRVFVGVSASGSAYGWSIGRSF